MKVNLEFKYNNPLEIDMPSGKVKNFTPYLFPRGAPEIQREFTNVHQQFGGYFVREINVYQLDIFIRPLKAFSNPTGAYEQVPDLGQAINEH